MQVFEWEVGERGLQYDREWAIQKQEPRLNLIRPYIQPTALELVLQYEGMHSHSSPTFTYSLLVIPFMFVFIHHLVKTLHNQNSGIYSFTVVLCVYSPATYTSQHWGEADR